jgi:cytochrome P450 family 135
MSAAAESRAAISPRAPSDSRRGLPPGPGWPMALQTLLGVFFSERFVDYCLEHFESLVTLRIAGLGTVVTVFDPELIKEVFTGDPEQLLAGRANARFLQAPAGESSVLVIDGEEHLRTRRLLLPSFHGDAVRAHTDLIRSITAAEVERWPIGKPFAVHPRMQAITLEVILRAVIGVRDERRLSRLRSLLPRVAGANLFAFWAEGAMPGLARGAVGSRMPWIAARREADGLLLEEIAAHRADPGGREDVLAMLIAAGAEQGAPLSDAELRDQVITLLVAGHETTASTLAWCLERLQRNPRCLQRLQQEIADGAEDAYLDAVVNETFRTRPVIDQAVRMLDVPTEIGGYVIPAGTTVAASILEGAEEFRPERFLDRPPAPYTLIPFGGGVRRCIGASFAVTEIKTILRTTLERLRLQTTTHRPERPVRWRRFTVTPARGGRVTISARTGVGRPGSAAPA